MNLFILPLVATLCTTAGLAFYTYRTSDAPHSRTLTWLLSAMSLWVLSYLLQLVLPGYYSRLIFSNICYVFIPAVPILWFIFSIQYAGYKRRILPGSIWPLCIIPLIVQFAVWTDPVFHLFRSSVSLEVQSGIEGFVSSYGPVFWLHTFYSYLLLFLGVIYIIRKVVTVPHVPTTQAFLLLGACFLPLSVNIIYLFSDLSRAGIFDWTPISLSVSAVMFTYATFRFKLLEPTPVAHKYVFESMSEGILVLNHNDIIIDANPGVVFFFGEKPGRLIGTPVNAWEIFTSVDLSLVGKKYARGLTINGPDGKQIYCELVVQKFRFEYEREEGRLIVLRDITYRKRLEDELSKRQKYESLERLAGGLARDFNNFLGMVTGNTALARTELEKGPVTDILDNVEAACERTKMLTHQLLSFARGESVTITEFDIVPLIQNTARLYTAVNSVAFEDNLPVGLWPVQADREQMERVFQNLFVNAFQAMNGQGAITVEGANVQLEEHNTERSMSQGRYIRIAVRDSGPGIPEEHISHVFDPYFTTRKDGHGLGLSLVYSIIKRHGGTIHVESTRWGACFTMYLPAV